jgi:hypothetical protein
MTSGGSRATLARYAACYLIWVALCALMGLVLTQAVAALLEISLALQLNPWVGRAVRQLSLPVLGICWLVLIFWSEHALRTSVPRGDLAKRALRFAIPLLGVLALLWLIQALL